MTPRFDYFEFSQNIAGNCIRGTEDLYTVYGVLPNKRGGFLKMALAENCTAANAQLFVNALELDADVTANFSKQRA